MPAIGAAAAALAASFCYQGQLFNREIRQLNIDGVLAWRARFRERLETIAMRYPPRSDVVLEAMADMATLVRAACVPAALIPRSRFSRGKSRSNKRNRLGVFWRLSIAAGRCRVMTNE